MQSRSVLKLMRFLLPALCTLTISIAHAAPPLEAIKASAGNEAQVPFAEDFADLFDKLSSDVPQLDDSIYGHAACMVLGAARFPDLKERIDSVLESSPIRDVVFRYGEPGSLPFVDLSNAAQKGLAGIGMSPIRLEAQCGGKLVPVGEKEISDLANKLQRERLKEEAARGSRKVEQEVSEETMRGEILKTILKLSEEEKPVTGGDILAMLCPPFPPNRLCAALEHMFSEGIISTGDEKFDLAKEIMLRK